MLDQASATRSVKLISPGVPASDGAGVKLNRVIGTARLSELDPFLLLDEIRSDDGADYIGGFPDHPHRGFETVTVMLAGRTRHGDNKGHSGLLRAGSVQWMTAGRGIVHSEMPEQEDGLMWGFQLWVNLPAKDKMTAPRYQEIAPEQVPEVALAGGGKVRVIAGRVGGVSGPIDGIATAPILLDIALPAGGSVALPLPEGHNAFIYPFEGEALIGTPALKVTRGSLAVLGPGQGVALAAGVDAARMLLAAARPLNESIVRYGPFVMNSEAEIHAAIADYRAGRL
jgi:quercetin 2,3-dioxygenase